MTINCTGYNILNSCDINVYTLYYSIHCTIVCAYIEELFMDCDLCHYCLLDGLVVRVLASSAGGPRFNPQSRKASYQRCYKNGTWVVPLFCTQHWKGKYWLFLKNYDKKIMQWIKSGIEHPSKSEVIGRCGGDETTDWLRRTDKSRTLKKVPCRIYRVSRLQFA